MNRRGIWLLTIVGFVTTAGPMPTAVAQSGSSSTLASQWLSWRGPNGNGIAASASAPTEFGPNANVIWRQNVPGRGHSSPTIVGSVVALTTADESKQVQSVVAYHRESGKPLWKKDLHQGSFNPKIHSKNTHASPTLASDGRQLFAVFNNSGAVMVSKLSLTGELVWQKKAGDYSPKAYQFGYAPSPAIHQGKLIIVADFEASGYLTALDTGTGEPLWRTKRPSQISYSSPIVARTSGRDQILLSGASQIASYDPATGNRLWSAAVTAPATCGTLVWSDKAVFASGGYPKRETAAVLSDGSAKVLWTNSVKCYEQSMLYTNGYLYGVDDKGIAYCWNATTGQEKWKQRLEGGAVSSSPTLVGETIYVGNERGSWYVFKANPDQFTPVAKNQLGNSAFASPAIVDGKLFIRAAASVDGRRQESLFCFGD